MQKRSMQAMPNQEWRLYQLSTPFSLWNFHADQIPIMLKQNAENCSERWMNFLKVFVPVIVLYASKAASFSIGAYQGKV